MLEITLHLRTEQEVDEAAALLKRLFELRTLRPAEPEPTDKITLGDLLRGFKPKPEPAAEPEPEPEPVGAWQEDENDVTLEQIRAVFAALSTSGKREQVIALLAELGAAKLTEVDPSDYPSLLAKAKEL